MNTALIYVQQNLFNNKTIFLAALTISNSFSCLGSDSISQKDKKKKKKTIMYPRWNYDFTGRGRHIKKRPVQFEKQLTEVLFPTYAQQHVLTLARYLDTDEAIMVKIRYGYVVYSRI